MYIAVKFTFGDSVGIHHPHYSAVVQRVAWLQKLQMQILYTNNFKMHLHYIRFLAIFNEATRQYPWSTTEQKSMINRFILCTPTPAELCLQGRKQNP